jgi:hypothetical protein
MTWRRCSSQERFVVCEAERLPGRGVEDFYAQPSGLMVEVNEDERHVEVQKSEGGACGLIHQVRSQPQAPRPRRDRTRHRCQLRRRRRPHASPDGWRPWLLGSAAIAVRCRGSCSRRRRHRPAPFPSLPERCPRWSGLRTRTRDDPIDVRAVAVAVIWKRIGNRRGIVRR